MSPPNAAVKHTALTRRRGPAGLSLGGRYSLWLGPDHLLYVVNDGYTEAYKRFYFRNIQAVGLVRTRAANVYGLLWGGLALTLLAVALTGVRFAWPAPAWILVAAAAALLALGFLVNLLLGPTCDCFLRTAVQTERLYPIHRMRAATRAFERIREAVRAAQGELDADAALRYQALPAFAAPAAAAPPPAIVARHRASRPPRHCRGHVHGMLFGLLLVDAIRSLLPLWANSPGLVAAGMFLAVLLAGTVVAALIRQSGSDLPPAVRQLTWIALGFVVFHYLASTVATIAFTLREGLASPADDPAAFARSAGSLDPLASPVQTTLLIVSAVAAGAIGTGGLLALRKRRTLIAVPPPLPAVPGEPPAP